MNERRLPFPERLRYERERRGWSLADLAAKIGVNTNTIGRWERGESLPRSYPLSRLATLFGMSTEELTLMPALGEQSSLSSATPRYIEFAIEQGDITSFDADIVSRSRGRERALLTKCRH